MIWRKIAAVWSKFWGGFHRVFSICTIYKQILLILGLIVPKKVYPDTDTQKRYAVIICARNERLVIGNLIDSIHAQSYPAHLISTFVVADNCTDDTARICRDKGCTVYERHDPDHARKGYAMEYLFAQIDADYGINAFDGYVIFDADNLLHPDFITQLNKAFVATDGNIVVGYRNTKNFDRNFISAGYGIHFMRSVVAYHRPRGFLGTATHIAGTGYVIPARLLQNGWHYTCLTEDTQFSLESVAAGEIISFCEDAEFFDEQPYQVKVMMRQRLRWIKGRLYAFFTALPRLFTGIFTKNLRKSFSCYDMLFYAFPSSLYHALREIAFPAIGWVLTFLFSLWIGKETGVTAAAAEPQTALLGFATLLSLGLKLIWTLGKKILVGALIVIREHKKIHCSTPKLVLYTLLFPWFDLIGGPLALMALFSTSQWKPIKHDAAISIDQLSQGGPRK